MNPPRYTAEEDQRIRDMAAAGATVNEIAATFPNRNRNGVYDRMRKLRVKAKTDPVVHAERRERMIPLVRDLAGEGYSASEAARIMSHQLGENIKKAMVLGLSWRHKITFTGARKRTATTLSRGTRELRARKSNEMKVVRAKDPGPPKEPKPWTPDADFSPNEHTERFTRLLNGAAVPNKSNRVYLPDLPGPKQCRHITGDIREPGAFWCGEPVSEGSSYSACHRVICTALSKPNDRKRAREILSLANEVQLCPVA